VQIYYGVETQLFNNIGNMHQHQKTQTAKNNKKIRYNSDAEKCGEILGVKESTKGRSCKSHNLCGKSILCDEWDCFILTVVRVNGKTEEAI
jgi:hypothetical protein